MGLIVSSLLGKKCQAVYDKEQSTCTSLRTGKAKLQKAEQNVLWAHGCVEKVYKQEFLHCRRETNRVDHQLCCPGLTS